MGDDVDMEYLAIDIGASSGKLLKGWLEDGILRTEVVHRFPNSLIKAAGHACWDIAYLEDEVIRGIAKAGSVDFVSIDTWAVDYVLLGSGGEPIAPAVSYRDSRTEDVICPVPKEELYRRTGIQFQRFNTIYQLLAQKAEDSSVLGKAESLLFIPDYLAYRLTGVKVQEYTNATTTNLLKAGEREWDMDLIRELGLPERLFGEVSMPGKVLGRLRPEIREKTGNDPLFILGPTHDTACAVLASPLGRNSLYLSSGTWSLLGSVNGNAITGDEAFRSNFTNEGADDGRIRFLKNIMGTWMLQNIRKETGSGISFDEIVSRAEASELPGLVDPLSERFLAPESMTEEIASALSEQGIRRPQYIGETALVVYHSLASAYRDAIREIGNITGRRFDHLAIVGGGSKDTFLDRLTKEYTGIRVTAGPDEGSAIGSLLSAMMHTDAIRREDIPSLLSASFDIRTI